MRWNGNMYSLHTFGTKKIVSSNFVDQCSSPVAALLFNSNYKWFVYENSAIVFFKYNNTLISVGGILSSLKNKTVILDKFLEFCKKNDLSYIFIHFDSTDAAIFNSRGLLVNQIGSSYIIDCADYSMAGKPFQQLRNKINKAKKKNVAITKIQTDEELQNIMSQIDFINSCWIKNKGDKPLKNVVGNVNDIKLVGGLSNIYVAIDSNDKIIAYVVYSRNFGKYDGWFYNLSRNLDDIPNGTMQAINSFAMKDLAPFKYLSFGYTPLTDINSNTKFRKSRAC